MQLKKVLFLTRKKLITKVKEELSELVPNVIKRGLVQLYLKKIQGGKKVFLTELKKLLQPSKKEPVCQQAILSLCSF